MTHSALNQAFLSALSTELDAAGYGIVDPKLIAEFGMVRLSRSNGANVKTTIDIGAGGGQVWHEVAGVSYLGPEFTTPPKDADAEAVDVVVQKIMLPLTWRSDIDPIENEPAYA